MIRLLVLDDDELFVSTLIRRLRSVDEMDFAPTPALTAEEAIRAVEQASEPFDVFLIDQLLDYGVNGIDVMQQLRRMSPQTEAIILTGYSDAEAGALAYEAGAYRYLTKPPKIRELVLVIRSFVHLRVMTQVAEAAQRAMSTQAVAEIVVHGALRLGFERARLWELHEASGELVGISQAGNQGLEPFNTITMKLGESPYTYELLQHHEPLFFTGHERGETYLHHLYAPAYKQARGDWVLIPLWSEQGCQGVLSLDNADIERRIHQDQRTILSLFGRQVAAALERARLQATDARKTRELEVLNQIGKEVADRATRIGTKRLLREVRKLLAPLIYTHNFRVVLRRPEDRQLEVCLEYENNQQRPTRMLSARRGLTQHVMQINKPLLLAGGTTEYRAAHNLVASGLPSRCWLGVPLAIDNRVIGAIVVQDYHHEGRFTTQDQRLLELVAQQIAAPIEMLRQKEQEHANGRRLARLHLANETILKLAQENDKWLWHAVLTLATAEYALQFNRAMLFLAEQNGRRFRGSLGIGHLRRHEAERSWENDRRGRMDFERYVDLLRAGELTPTPIEQQLPDMVIDCTSEHDAFATALARGQRIKLSTRRAQQRMPAAFIRQFGVTEYAVLPLRLHDQPFGVLVVDHMFTRRRLETRPLEQLEQLLTQAVLIFDNVRQRRVRDQLITLNHTVLAQAEIQTLGEILTQISEAARASVGADCVAIFPCQADANAGLLMYDREHIGAAGMHEPHSLADTFPAMLSAAIARGEALDHLGAAQLAWFATERQRAEGLFAREQLCAFMSRPIVDDTTSQIIGVLLLGYRSPQAVSAHDRFNIESFVRLSSMTIRSTNARRKLDRMIWLSQERGKELDRLRQVLQALSPSPDRKRMALALLSAVHELLGQADVRMGLILREWVADASDDSPREARRMFLLRPGAPHHTASEDDIDEQIDDDLESGITGRAFQTGESQLIPDVHSEEVANLFRANGIMGTRSELDVPIKLNGKVIGVFNAESSQPKAFNKAHRHILERLAAAAALALDNVARQEHLRNVLDAAQVVIKPTGLRDTLRAVLNAARKAAPDVAALTIWYKEPLTNSIRLGPYFGVRDPSGMTLAPPDPNSLVATITQYDEPIWAADARQNDRLARRFVAAEAIVSVAAFPLRIEHESVGALFFNYRQPHTWGNEERVLFPIISAIAAASIRDALRLEATRKERDRLSAAIAISEAVGTSLELNDALHKIFGTLRDRFHQATPGVLLYNATLERLEFTTASLEYYKTNRLSENSIPLNGTSIAASLARRALHSGQVEYLNEANVHTNPEYLPAIKNTCTQLSVTLMGNEQLLGVLVLEWPFYNAFEDDDIPLIVSIARQISLAIERAHQSRELRVRTIVATHTAWAAEIAHDTNREISRIRQRAYRLRHMPNLDMPTMHGLAHEIDAAAARLAEVASAGYAPAKGGLPIDNWLRQRLPTMLDEREVAISLYLHDLQCPNVYVGIDALVLERVFRHLIRNAIEAMNSVGKIFVRSRQRNGHMVEVQVLDTGPGVPADVRAHLFNDIVSTKGPNGGMGLLYAQSAIKQNGGDIVLLPHSAGQGAAFVVMLPLTAIHHEEASAL